MHDMGPSAAAGCDEEYLLTEEEAQLAATLALMTGFGQGCCPAHRAPMAERVAGQLARLADGPQVSPDMRSFLQRLGQRWQASAQRQLAADSAAHVSAQASAAATTDLSTPRALWHAPLETMQ